MKVGSLFTGAGGLDMAVQWLWPDAELAWFAETDAHAAAVFVHHHDAPNLGDLREVEWDEVEPVDVMVGGYPCQPWSNAGKRQGADDDRDGWPWFREAVGALGPAVVLLENVRGHVVPAGAGRTVGDLSDLGYDCQWTTLRASDVGAAHQRDRWFAVAHDPDRAGGCEAVEHDGRGAPEGYGAGVSHEPDRDVGGVGPYRVTTLPTPRSSDGPHGGPNQTGDGLQPAVRTLPTPRSNADRNSRASLTREGHWSGPALEQAVELAQGVLPREYESWDEVQGWHGRNLPTPRAEERQQRNSADNYVALSAVDRWGDYAQAIARWEQVHGPAPEPTDGKGRLSPTFVEWLMGWEDGYTAVAGASRSQRLKMLGNGVVPHQAYAAYSGLLARAARQEAAA